MPSLRSAVLWAALGALAAAAPAEYTHKMKETVRAPRGFTALRPAPSGHVIELRIGLPQPNFAELEEHLYAVRCVSAGQLDVDRCANRVPACPVIRRVSGMASIYPRRKWRH